MRDKLYFAIPVTIIFVAWVIGSRFTTSLFLPSPDSVFSTLLAMTKSGLIGDALLQSFIRITIATLASAAVAVPLGLLAASYDGLNKLVSPTINFMRYLPVTAFYPLLIMWVGIGEEMRISFLFCATIFYFLPSVMLAVNEVNKELVDTGRTMGMSYFQVITQILLPASFPSICESFLMMYGIGWTYIIIAEVINTNNGLGHIIQIASARGRTDMVFAALIVIILFSVIFDSLGKKLIKAKFSWKYMNSMKSEVQS